MNDRELISVINPTNDKAYSWLLSQALVNPELFVASHKALVVQAAAERWQVPYHKVVGIDPEHARRQHDEEPSSDLPTEAVEFKLAQVREYLDPRMKRSELLEAMKLTYAMVGPQRFIDVLLEATKQTCQLDGRTAVRQLIRSKKVYAADVCARVNGEAVHRFQRDSQHEPTPTQVASMRRRIKEVFWGNNQIDWYVGAGLGLHDRVVVTEPIHLRAQLPPFAEMRRWHASRREQAKVQHGFLDTYQFFKGPGLNLTKLITDMELPFEIVEGTVARPISAAEAVALIVDKVPPLVVIHELQRLVVQENGPSRQSQDVSHLLGQTRLAMVG